MLASKGLVNYYINIKFLFFFHDRFNVLRFQLVGEKLCRKDFRLFFRIISERFFSHNVLELNGKVHSRKTSIYEQGILFKFLNFSGKKTIRRISRSFNSNYYLSNNPIIEFKVNTLRNKVRNIKNLKLGIQKF